MEKQVLIRNLKVQHRNQKGEKSFNQCKYECTYLQLIKTLISHASVNLLPTENFNDYRLPDYKHPDSKKSYKSVSFVTVSAKTSLVCTKI